MPRKHAYSPRHAVQPKRGKLLLVGLIIGLSVACFFLVMMFISWSKPFPIRKVEITGNHQHISKLMLYDVMMPELSEGFFGLSVSKLREDLCYLPWVKDAIVGRVWPDRLRVKIIEHEPLAVWNDRAIITMNGALIMPDNVSLLSTLPRFYGLEGKQEQVVSLWKAVNEMLTKIDLDVASIELAPRGAWQLTLSNGIKVRVGTQEISKRLQRFVRVYDTLLYKQHKNVAYVDLRYTSGLAVGWKESS